MYSQGETFYHDIDDEEYELHVIENVVMGDKEYIITEDFDGQIHVFLYDEEEEDIYLIEDSDAMEVIEYWREEYLSGDDIGDYEEDDKITYEYKSKLGDCKISLHNEKVFIQRKNNGIENVIEVDLNNMTEFLYCGEGFEKNFHILGEKITYKQNILEFSYKILDNGEEVNNISITIKEY